MTLPGDLGAALDRYEARLYSRRRHGVAALRREWPHRRVRRAIEDDDLRPFDTAIREEDRTYAGEVGKAAIIGGSIALSWIGEDELDSLDEQTTRLIRDLRDEVRFALDDDARAQIGRARFASNADQAARDLIDTLGLTERQGIAVMNYRAQLIADAGTKFSTSMSVRGQIAKQVTRYADKIARRRARTAARLHALQALHLGMREGLRQAIAAGSFSAEQLRQVWQTRDDDKVRATHQTMHGQARAFGELFETGAGIAIRYPGDPEAPLNEIINCRCVLAVEVLSAAQQVPQPSEATTLTVPIRVEIRGGFIPEAA